MAHVEPNKPFRIRITYPETYYTIDALDEREAIETADWYHATRIPRRKIEIIK